MSKYILISNGDENISFPIDTDGEREAARAALTAAGETSASVFVGDSEDPDSYASGDTFRIEASHLEIELARCCARDAQLPAIRVESLKIAIAAGADRQMLDVLTDAQRVSRTDTIVLPRQRYENLSRGKGWARKGSKNNAEWGERESGGYRVGPGTWTVGGNDGFSRKGEDKWVVKHVTVGTETWTIAS